MPSPGHQPALPVNHTAPRNVCTLFLFPPPPFSHAIVRGRNTLPHTLHTAVHNNRHHHPNEAASLGTIATACAMLPPFFSPLLSRSLLRQAAVLLVSLSSLPPLCDPAPLPPLPSQLLPVFSGCGPSPSLKCPVSQACPPSSSTRSAAGPYFIRSIVVFAASAPSL